MSIASGNSTVNVNKSVAGSKVLSEAIMVPEEDGGDDDLEAALSSGMEARLNEKITEVQNQVD